METRIASKRLFGRVIFTRTGMYFTRKRSWAHLHLDPATEAPRPRDTGRLNGPICTRGQRNWQRSRRTFPGKDKRTADIGLIWNQPHIGCLSDVLTAFPEIEARDSDLRDQFEALDLAALRQQPKIYTAGGITGREALFVRLTEATCFVTHQQVGRHPTVAASLL